MNIEILPTETDKLAWWKPYEGTIRQVIEITSWGDPFLIDNEDGLGYVKITDGAGMWTSGSRHYDNVNYRIVSETPNDQIVTEFSKVKYDEAELVYGEYWQSREPEKYRSLKALLASGPPKFQFNEK